MSAYNSSFSSPQVEQAISAALLQEKSSYNITQDKKQNYASLTEAIAAVSDNKYKVNGLVLTFYTGTEWVSKRYNGTDASGFATEDNWMDAGGAGGSQYLDLSIFSEESGTLSEEDYQKVVKAYKDRVNIGFINNTNFLIIINKDTQRISIILSLLGNDNKDMALSATEISINISDKSYTGSIDNIIDFLILKRSGDGTKVLADDGRYVKFASPTKVISGSSGAVTQELSPNTYYEFGECTNLTITLAEETPNIYNEYMFEFTSGTTPTTLGLPSTVKWNGGDAPTIEANKSYIVAIVNNIAVIGGA